MGAIFSRAFVSTLGVLYPAYASFKVLESPAQDDDKQWLTYWIVYAITTSIEEVAETILAFVPGYYVVKCIFLVWLMLPKTRGALIVYNNVLRPLLKQYEPLLDEKLLHSKNLIDNFIDEWQERARIYLRTELPKIF